MTALATIIGWIGLAGIAYDWFNSTTPSWIARMFMVFMLIVSTIWLVNDLNIYNMLLVVGWSTLITFKQ